LQAKGQLHSTCTAPRSRRHLPAFERLARRAIYGVPVQVHGRVAHRGVGRFCRHAIRGARRVVVDGVKTLHVKLEIGACARHVTEAVHQLGICVCSARDFGGESVQKDWFFIISLLTRGHRLNDRGSRAMAKVRTSRATQGDALRPRRRWRLDIIACDAVSCPLGGGGGGGVVRLQRTNECGWGTGRVSSPLSRFGMKK
jgi:hypothetical protein